MKYFTFIIISAMITQSSIAAPKSDNDELVIHGTLYKMKEPIKYVYIQILKIDSSNIDSVMIVNNKYTYTAKMTGISFVTLYSKNPDKPDSVNTLQAKDILPLLLGPGTVNV